MLSIKTVQSVHQRIYSFNFCGGTFLTFDKKSGKIAPANIYLYYNAINGVVGLLLFALVHSVQLYTNLNPNTIPEDGPNEVGFERKQMFAFTTNVIELGEILVVSGLCCLGYVLFKQRHNFVYVYNEIFSCNQNIMNFLKDRNIQLDLEHKKAMKKLERIAFGGNIFSAIIGVFVVITGFHPLEPTHVVIQDWLEIDWKPTPRLLPWIFMFGCAIQSAGNLLVSIAWLVMVYCPLASRFLDDLTVERVHSKIGKRCKIQTRFFGVLDDQEICELYRTQRYLNTRLNEILSTLFVSFHQVGLLATLSIMLFFFVKFQNLIWEVGILAGAVVVGATISPLLVSWFQSQFFGGLVEISDAFSENAMKIVPRNTMFRRFAHTCQTYYVEEAYPFFHFYKNTFLEFCATGLNYSITLMLW